MSVNNRVAIVTGSGSGVGEQIAKKLAENGAKVIINDIDQDKIYRVVSEIKEKNGVAIGIKSDVTKPAEVKTMFENIVENFGKVDILVNNVSVERNDLVQNLSIEDWDEVLNTNLRSIFLTSQIAAQYMMGNNYGRIVNISSREWLGSPNQSHFSASKGGVFSFTRSLALELAKHQITSNVICAGLIEDTSSYRNLKEEEKERLTKMQPTRSIGAQNDIANGVLFLAADESSYITGQTLFIDGGKNLFSSYSV